MSYSVFFDEKAVNYLKRLDKKFSESILKSIWKLREKPKYFGKQLTGIDLWVLRVGDYRILYGIDEGTKKVEIVFIGHRRNIYRKL